MIEKVYYCKRDPDTKIPLIFPKELKREPYVPGKNLWDDIMATTLLHPIGPVIG